MWPALPAVPPAACAKSFICTSIRENALFVVPPSTIHELLPVAGEQAFQRLQGLEGPRPSFAGHANQLLFRLKEEHVCHR